MSGYWRAERGGWERVYDLRFWWESGKCDESSVGLYVVNGEHDGVARCVGSSEHDEVNQCEVGVG